MTKSFKTRVKAMEHGMEHGLEGSVDFDFGQALREARLLAAAGQSPPQSPITAEMMEDPIHGEFYRQLSKARERVRLLR